MNQNLDYSFLAATISDLQHCDFATAVSAAWGNHFEGTRKNISALDTGQMAVEVISNIPAEIFDTAWREIQPLRSGEC